MKIFLKYIMLLLILAGNVACDKNEKNYPREIAFTEYSLVEILCQWTNLNYSNEVIIINSKEKLGNYIDCISGSYSEIDFSKHSLLLASGATDAAITEIVLKDLLQLSAYKYNLSVDMSLNPLFAGTTWNKALLVEKLNERSSIDLTINNTYLETPCDCIMDTIKGEWSWVKTYEAWFGMKDNRFKSIVRILSQNEDASVNYEVFVEDTLFFKGSFQIKNQPLYSHERLFNIRLPHEIRPGIFRDRWVISFSDHSLFGSSKETLAFWNGGLDGHVFYYNKIK